MNTLCQIECKQVGLETSQDGFVERGWGGHPKHKVTNPTNHAAKGSMFVDLRNPGNLKTCHSTDLRAGGNARRSRVPDGGEVGFARSLNPLKFVNLIC